MRQVIEAVDGPIALNVCLCEEKVSRRKPWCPSHPVWVRAQAAMLAVLESAQVLDLAEQGAVNEFTLVATSCLAPAMTSSAAN
jgi:DNA-binding IscR family transcriptional regulator